jgi:hypothetical protein
MWAMARHFNKASGGLADAIAHESFHVLQANDDRVSLSSSLSDNRAGVSLLFNERSGFVKYLSNECELQARLFTIVSNAYIQHGRMPLNKYELWACLASQGMTPPDEILAMARKNPECAKAFSLFPKSEEYVKNYSDRMSAGQLDEVQEGIEDSANKVKLWTHAYPFLYGDMLEIMGDRLGQKRMGGSHNVQLREIFMKAARDNMKGNLSNQNVMAQMKKAANMMAPDDALLLMQDIAVGKPYKEFSEESIFIPAGNLRVASAFALAANPKVNTRQAASILQRATGLSPLEWKNEMALAQRMTDAKNVTTTPKIKGGKRRYMVANPVDLGSRLSFG